MSTRSRATRRGVSTHRVAAADSPAGWLCDAACRPRKARALTAAWADAGALALCVTAAAPDRSAAAAAGAGAGAASRTVKLSPLAMPRLLMGVACAASACTRAKQACWCHANLCGSDCVMCHSAQHTLLAPASTHRHATCTGRGGKPASSSLSAGQPVAAWMAACSSSRVVAGPEARHSVAWPLLLRTRSVQLMLRACAVGCRPHAARPLVSPAAVGVMLCCTG
jgi:hypothetical protein